MIFFIIGFLFVFSASVYHNVFAKSPEPVSKLLFTYNGDLFNVKTKEKTVLGAVREIGLDITEQDNINIPKETGLTGQSIYFSVEKAWPIAIYDDNKLIVGKTSSTDPAIILAQNGIKIWPEDKITEELNLAPDLTNSAGQIIRIKRAPVYKILVDDNTIEVRSWGASINDVIGGKVTLGPRDIVEPGLSAPAVPQEIIVTRINVVESEENVSIPFKTTYQDDWFVPQGTEKKVVSGENGTKKRNLKITFKNGQEISRIIISESTTENPVTEVIKKGQMPSGSSDFNRSWWDVMVAAGSKYGVSPLSLFRVAACESHVNPESIGGGGQYLGMYQYTSGFWGQASAAAGFGGAAWSDGTAQIYSTAAWAARNGWGRWGCNP